jgi:hypothetical protein
MKRMRGRTGRTTGVHGVEVQQADLLSDITAAVEARGMSFRDFISQGLSDQLDDPELRDLWLMAGFARAPADARVAR